MASPTLVGFLPLFKNKKKGLFILGVVELLDLSYGGVSGGGWRWLGGINVLALSLARCVSVRDAICEWGGMDVG